ncbi:MAG: hypothetical protein H0W64_09860 [Gammaproteobacteria bacterium]|nr:hypothetical protein [Gammaproteobacteria bacterium]
MAQVVPGFDSKHGLPYNRIWGNLDFTLEAGYRFAYYINAIAIIQLGTLVQAKLGTLQPELATGTMAINSTDSRYSPFTLNGPYLNLTIALL